MNLITSIPEYITSESGQAFMLGMGAGAMIALTRAALRWFRAAAHDTGGAE